MSYDFLGSAASLLSTYYFIRLNRNAWPVGLFATCLNGWLYWQKGIYADACLQLFYFFSLSYGWYLWSKKTSETASENILTRLSLKQWSLLILLGSLLYATITYLLITHLHSEIARIDAFSTTLSLVSQWLMCHKVILTWVGWFIVDAVYAVIYLQKNLPFHSALMLFYTGMAVVGYLSWSKQCAKSRPLHSPKTETIKTTPLTPPRPLTPE